MNFKYKEENPFDHRRAESTSIRTKYPDRLPVIIEKIPGAQLRDLDKTKFLIPSDISVSQLSWIIRQRISLEQEKALCLYINKTMPVASASVGQTYELHHDEDGFLYIAYGGENTFGAGNQQSV